MSNDHSFHTADLATSQIAAIGILAGSVLAVTSDDAARAAAGRDALRKLVRDTLEQSRASIEECEQYMARLLAGRLGQGLKAELAPMARMLSALKDMLPIIEALAGPDLAEPEQPKGVEPNATVVELSDLGGWRLKFDDDGTVTFPFKPEVFDRPAEVRVGTRVHAILSDGARPMRAIVCVTEPQS